MNKTSIASVPPYAALIFDCDVLGAGYLSYALKPGFVVLGRKQQVRYGRSLPIPECV